MNTLRFYLQCSLSLFAIGFYTASADAASITEDFTSITNNDAVNAAAGEAQLSVTISDTFNGNPLTNQVAFTFNNVGPVAMSITDVYFDDGSLLGIFSIVNGPGVSFTTGASPGDPPGGESINFNTSAGFLADSTTPNLVENGVNPGETLTIIFDLKPGKTYQSVLDAIELSKLNYGQDVDDGLRIAIHVQAFADGGSEAFFNWPPPGGPDPNNVVPEPASIALFGLGALGMGVLARRRKEDHELV